MEKTDKTHPYIRKDARREMIAVAARQLIAEKGLAALRTRAIAERVGINISTLHFHVSGKSALLDFVAVTTRDAFMALLPPEPDPALNAHEQLRNEVQAYHDSLRDHPDMAVCFAQLSQAAATQPELAQTLEDFTRNWCGRYVRIMSFGRDQGIFRANLDPFAAALMVTGALTAFAARGPAGLTQFWPVFSEIERSLLVPA